MTNVMNIEQTLEQNRLAVEMVQNSRVQTIRLVTATVSRGSAPEELEGGLSTSLEFKPGASTVTESGLRLCVEFEFAISSRSGEEASPKRALSISCTLEGVYALRPGFAPSGEQVSAFHASNVMIACWPYFREFIQSAAQRVDYPRPPIPFLLLTPKAEAPVKGSEKAVSPKGRREGKKRIKGDR